MKPVPAASLAIALGLCLITPVHGQEPTGDEWARSAPVDQSYSIETPCTVAEVREQSMLPLEVNGSILDPDSNVSCIVGELLFSSGALSVAASEIGDANLFDYVVSMLEQEAVRSEVVIQQTNLAGKRAIISREVRNGEVAQTGIVELSNRELLMLISGGKPTAGEDVAVLIDRHVESLKVASK